MSRYEASMLYARVSSGPLPDPETLERYSQIVPGGAERIFVWAEQQSAHRQSLEKARLEGDTNNETRGQWFAFVITMTVIACGTFLSYTGHGTAGLSLMLGDLALLAGVFVYGKRLQVKELREKMKGLLAPPPPGESSDDQ
jgi:uncharacterized membrane protein